MQSSITPPLSAAGHLAYPWIRLVNAKQARTLGHLMPVAPCNLAVKMSGFELLVQMAYWAEQWRWYSCHNTETEASLIKLGCRGTVVHASCSQSCIGRGCVVGGVRALNACIHLFAIKETLLNTALQILYFKRGFALHTSSSAQRHACALRGVKDSCI